MDIYEPNYRYHCHHKFDKQLISEVYKQVCININYEDYNPDSDILAEYYLSKLSGMYRRDDDKIHIDALIGRRKRGQGFYNVYVSHMNIRTIDQGFKSYSPKRCWMDYYIRIKRMQIKLGMIRMSNFKGIGEYKL